ncbi:MAG: VacJ family lipoprotein [Sulfurimonas sp.]|uniref:MlaA family lipoprotein n=1 Tax=Sulfurimonas sp. TaxID=2022749 RepID=UPI002635CF6F|nr:VacJ family lipoprotein [Sulfurimonas sp.]MDD5373191.1 VacJ family lipoprotein [Sulfurimonas sp.]
MRFIYLTICLSIILNFAGCSSKNIEKPSEAALYEAKENNAVNGDVEEFSDEFKTEEVYDPFSGYNRFMTGFNDGAYEYVLKPVSKGYKTVLHVEIRESVRNFFNNLYFPMRFANNILQGKLSYASEEGARFVLNTTVGIAGLFDPAKSCFELQAHEEDFGQTLGFYGVGSGPHIVLPLLGPSNLRDMISLYPDSLLSPIDYNERRYWTLTDTLAEYLEAKSLENINYMSLNMDRYEKMRKDAVDLYPYLRDVYEQYRNKQIKE